MQPAQMVLEDVLASNEPPLGKVGPYVHHLLGIVGGEVTSSTTFACCVVVP